MYIAGNTQRAQKVPLSKKSKELTTAIKNLGNTAFTAIYEFTCILLP